MLMLCSLAVSTLSSRGARATQQKPAEKTPETGADKSQAKAPPKLPAQIDLLETHVRFEANGDSRKEVHALVKINDELGARQFARLNFSYNRAFQSVEIPFARITHANGGTSDVLASAITDNPDPAVVNFPAYQDIRVKSIRILGLAPDDSLEYRVVTTTTHHPLAPDFWFEHTFDRSGVVLQEQLTLEMPPALGYVHYNSQTPPETTSPPAGGYVYCWQRNTKPPSGERSDETATADVSASSFDTEVALATKLAPFLYPEPATDSTVASKASELTAGMHDDEERLRAVYAFVSKNIRTVELPLGATGFRTRASVDVLNSRAATQEDKATLVFALVRSMAHFTPTVCFAFRNDPTPPFYGLPADFEHVLLGVDSGVFGKPVWMDPAAEVAPFGMISRAYRDKTAFCPMKSRDDRGLGYWERIPDALPFAASQRVSVKAVLRETGTLNAKVNYTMRGDNELLLRTAFHQSPKEKWNEVAQLLALSDGFRGKILSTTTSDPYSTKDPFTVEYEIEQPKFADWSKKSLRIPALLPLLGLPDPPVKSAPGAASPIELGTPLDVEVTMTLRLPEGTGAEVPAGTSAERDFATYSSQYSVNGATLTASRHINFILKEIPADRAAEYSAFLHAVQNDESQFFTLERAGASAKAQKP